MKEMLIGAGLALGGLLLGFTFATRFDVLAEAKWWDLITAFGTLGAVITALGIAIHDSRRRVNDTKATIRVFGAVFQSDVMRVWALAKGEMKPIVELIETLGIGQEWPEDQRQLLRKKASDLQTPVLQQFLPHASQFPPAIASAIAVVLGEVVLIKHHTEGLCGEPKFLIDRSDLHACRLILSAIEQIDSKISVFTNKTGS